MVVNGEFLDETSGTTYGHPIHVNSTRVVTAQVGTSGVRLVFTDGSDLVIATNAKVNAELTSLLVPTT